jgi:hypothetical protein
MVPAHSKFHGEALREVGFDVGELHLVTAADEDVD